MGEDVIYSPIVSPIPTRVNLKTNEEKDQNNVRNDARPKASGSVATVVTAASRPTKRTIQRDTTLKLTALEDFGKKQD